CICSPPARPRSISSSARAPPSWRWSQRPSAHRTEEPNLDGPWSRAIPVWPVLSLVALLVTAGCASIGPGTGTRDPFDYTGAGPSGPIRPLIRIGSSLDRPSDAFLAVPYRGYWFWIDDRDMGSKRLFSFLMFMFTLVETGSKDGAPVLTIPTQ